MPLDSARLIGGIYFSGQTIKSGGKLLYTKLSEERKK